MQAFTDSKIVIGVMILSTINTALPERLHITCTESNRCILTWQPPPIFYKRQEPIFSYFIICSAHNRDARSDDGTVKRTYLSSYTNSVLVRLQPYQTYTCCVAAVNGAGRGHSSCQTVITHETGNHTINFNLLFLWCI